MAAAAWHSRIGNARQAEKNSAESQRATHGCRARLRLSGKRRGLVNVNNVLVPEETTLADGDWVSLSPDLLDI